MGRGLRTQLVPGGDHVLCSSGSFIRHVTGMKFDSPDGNAVCQGAALSVYSIAWRELPEEEITNKSKMAVSFQTLMLSALKCQSSKS
ncbi:hypothetical protein RRG08_005758 [Elysia crispata]|uniref:Uncharacterized protein n=1 Tax=Elysia crispata TaxID=231223 RepID=A0AAE0YCZ4_9GAST|nr:hypothetical protein RRG08_005758 [Elysia crispata]